MISRFTAALIAMLMISVSTSSAQSEGDYLYRVTALRAAPGKLEDLLRWFDEARSSAYYDDAREAPPLLMRHSQGDQWDLLLFSPMESFEAYYASKRIARRKRAQQDHYVLIERKSDLIAFSEDLFSYGPDLKTVRAAHEDNALYHVEMFHAGAGNMNALLDQRRMENHYLDATGRKPNMIFRVSDGGDVDVFTIGFYANLQAFAAPAPVDLAAREAAAVAAGFKNLDDISFLLRKLIDSHHDTLAVKVE